MLLSRRTVEERRRTPSLVDVTLDPAQAAAIRKPAGRALLVLGEAGHGKTTVLVHRVAHLWRTAKRALVLVPTEGLVRLLWPLMRKLGVDVDVWTFDAFARHQARRSFRRLPPESESAPPRVMRTKRSPKLRAAIAEIAARSTKRVSRRDLFHLFGDRALVDDEETLEWTRVQFSKTTERAWSHVVDKKRLVAVDGRALDDGTATAHATTIDVEDYPILFELDRLRAERPKEPSKFDLIAVDEAQELAPLELRLIGRSLARGGTLVVAGDADQHTDATSTFLGWDAAMKELGAEDHDAVTLDIGYRCPPDVVALAHLARSGGPLPAATPTSIAELGKELAALVEDDTSASVAIVCARPLTARAIAAGLARHVPARVVFDGKFLPRGPVQVTIVSEVKGLEFDYVLIVPAGMERNALYVAVTRARDQAVLVSSGEWGDSSPRPPSP